MIFTTWDMERNCGLHGTADGDWRDPTILTGRLGSQTTQLATTVMLHYTNVVSLTLDSTWRPFISHNNQTVRILFS